MTLIPGSLTRSQAVSGASPQDEATATWQGATFRTVSRNSACCALARDLVAAGCPEQPWEARNKTGQRTVYGDSLHALARTTINADGRFIRWHPRPDDAFKAPPLDQN
jgi:hypothetical protein